MSTTELFYRFGTALAIGFLVGLQREFSRLAESEPRSFAGVRTFALLGVLGSAAALAAEAAGEPAILVAAFAVVGALVVASYVVAARTGDVGITTEVAALLTVLIGTLCFHGMLRLAVALGVALTVLLSAKLETKRLAARLTREDLVAILKFGVVSAIILPVLPDEGLGPPPFDVVNPYKVWLMVVLISAIGFVGYVLIQLVGPRRGIGLTGVLGGLASSTAVTLSLTQKSRNRDRLAKPFALAIVVAWTMMFARVLVAAGVVNRALLGAIWFPMAVGAVLGLGYVVWLYYSDRSSPEESVEFSNPFELGPAFRFGILYGVVIFLSRMAQLQFGERGVYLSALVAGIADVDAVTLSLAELSRSEEVLDKGVAARGVVLAAMSNTLVKGGIVLSMGAPALRRVAWPALPHILGGALAAAFL